MSTCAIGGARSMRTCAHDGGGGSNVCHFGAYALGQIITLHFISIT